MSSLYLDGMDDACIYNFGAVFLRVENRDFSGFDAMPSVSI